MKTAAICLLMMLFAYPSLACADETTKEKPADAKKTSVLDFEMNSIDGKPVKLDKYKGQVFLMVNVASQCGLTKKNYEQLEPLHQKYKDRGFTVLAFPANNFLSQEPGTSAEIKKFCEKYNVTFDLFEKVSVKGDDCCDLYKFLIDHPDEDIAGEVKWNFQKYLVGRDGKVITKFGPRTNPMDKEITSAIEKALGETAPKEAATEQ